VVSCEGGGGGDDEGEEKMPCRGVAKAVGDGRRVRMTVLELLTALRARFAAIAATSDA